MRKIDGSAALLIKGKTGACGKSLRHFSRGGPCIWVYSEAALLPCATELCRNASAVPAVGKCRCRQYGATARFARRGRGEDRTERLVATSEIDAHRLIGSLCFRAHAERNVVVQPSFVAPGEYPRTRPLVRVRETAGNIKTVFAFSQQLARKVIRNLDPSFDPGAITN